MARTNPAILASIAAGLLLAVAPSVLSAEPVSWLSGESSSSDTTAQAEPSIGGDVSTLVISEIIAAASSQKVAHKKCVCGRIKGSAALGFSLGNGVIMELPSDSKQGEVTSPHTASKQKSLKYRTSAPEVHSKKRPSAPNQPWETEFLVWNAGQPGQPGQLSSQLDPLFLGELS